MNINPPNSTNPAILKKNFILETQHFLISKTPYFINIPGEITFFPRKKSFFSHFLMKIVKTFQCHCKKKDQIEPDFLEFPKNLISNDFTYEIDDTETGNNLKDLSFRSLENFERNAKDEGSNKENYLKKNDQSFLNVNEKRKESDESYQNFQSFVADVKEKNIDHRQKHFEKNPENLEIPKQFVQNKRNLIKKQKIGFDNIVNAFQEPDNKLPRKMKRDEFCAEIFENNEEVVPKKFIRKNKFIGRKKIYKDPEIEMKKSENAKTHLKFDFLNINFSEDSASEDDTQSNKSHEIETIKHQINSKIKEYEQFQGFNKPEIIIEIIKNKEEKAENHEKSKLILHNNIENSTENINNKNQLNELSRPEKTTENTEKIKESPKREKNIVLNPIFNSSSDGNLLSNPLSLFSNNNQSNGKRSSSKGESSKIDSSSLFIEPKPKILNGGSNSRKESLDIKPLTPKKKSEEISSREKIKSHEEEIQNQNRLSGSRKNSERNIEKNEKSDKKLIQEDQFINVKQSPAKKAANNPFLTTENNIILEPLHEYIKKLTKNSEQIPAENISHKNNPDTQNNFSNPFLEKIQQSPHKNKNDNATVPANKANSSEINLVSEKPFMFETPLQNNNPFLNANSTTNNILNGNQGYPAFSHNDIFSTNNNSQNQFQNIGNNQFLQSNSSAISTQNTGLFSGMNNNNNGISDFNEFNKTSGGLFGNLLSNINILNNNNNISNDSQSLFWNGGDNTSNMSMNTSRGNRKKKQRVHP